MIRPVTRLVVALMRSIGFTPTTSAEFDSERAANAFSRMRRAEKENRRLRRALRCLADGNDGRRFTAVEEFEDDGDA